MMIDPRRRSFKHYLLEKNRTLRRASINEHPWRTHRPHVRLNRSFYRKLINCQPIRTNKAIMSSNGANIRILMMAL